ncbi:MAG TPA: acyltransferase [Euzebyales bacterium]|nr:acyltransferase [Euzebyales bacterium]
MQQWASTRHVYVDNLKVVLIAAIIALHAILGYAGTIEAWSYTGVREVTLSPVTEGVLLVVVTPFGLFMIALLFLVAGLLTPPSLERKGTARFMRDRLLRLGVPFALFVGVVQPTMMYALEHPLGAAPGSYWDAYLGPERQLDTGVLWFVGVLLLFSLAYAAWARVWPHRPGRRAPAQITARHLLLVAAATAPAAFLVRLAYPYASESGFWDLNYWEWPACLAVFALGITGSRRGWLAAVPAQLRRRCGAITLWAVAAMAVFLAVASVLDVMDAAMGSWHWSAVVFAVIETALTVFGSVWLLGVAQRRLDRRIRWGPVLARRAYGAFMVQGVVLIGLAVALRAAPLPAEAKALIVAGGGIAGSFALAWLLISRVPVVARIL